MKMISMIDLVTEAKAHIANHAALRKLRQLAVETGTSYDWLRSMNQGRISNPTVGSIQKILDHKRQQEKSCQAFPMLTKTQQRIVI